jgi:hypothetical protein
LQHASCARWESQPFSRSASRCTQCRFFWHVLAYRRRFVSDPNCTISFLAFKVYASAAKSTMARGGGPVIGHPSLESCLGLVWVGSLPTAAMHVQDANQHGLRSRTLWGLLSRSRRLLMKEHLAGAVLVGGMQAAPRQHGQASNVLFTNFTCNPRQCTCIIDKCWLVARAVSLREFAAQGRAAPPWN